MPGLNTAVFLEYLDREFDKAKEEMDAAVDNLRECVQMAGHVDFRHSQREYQVATSLSALHIHQDISYPHKYLPADNRERYVSRDEVLSEIDDALRPTDPAKERAHSIWGLAGMGKTSAALAYANNTSRFDIVLWVKAESELSLFESFTN